MQQQGKSIRDYVYSSQMKIRSKFSIKNLLDDQPGLERNFASQQSQRLFRTSTARPQTMYGERVRMFLNDESKKAKMQTQIKLRRQQSSYKVIKSNSGTVQVKSVTQQEKIRMKKALGRMNLLAAGSQMEIQQQQQIQFLFHFISCLTQVDNHYQNAFKYLLKRLRELVFASSTDQIGLQVKKLADRTKNQFLLNFAYRNLGKTTFVSLSKQLLNETKHSVRMMQEARSKQTTGQQKNLQIIKQKQELIKKLKRQLKYYQQHPSQDLYPYVKKLQRQNKQMKQQIQELLQIKGDNQYTIQINQTSILLLSEQVQTLKAKIYEYQLAQLSGINQIEKNSELKQFQENVQNLKEMLDKSKLKMEGMKQEFDKVKAYNQQLLNERSSLAKRAAVGFGQLTPRPKIKDLFKQKNLIYEDYINLSLRNTTTQNIMKTLIEKIKNLQKAQVKKVEPKKKIELQQQENFQEDEFGMKKAIEYIEQTKGQVKKTSQSVQQVKRSLNKQKNERENIQKAQNKK